MSVNSFGSKAGKTKILKIDRLVVNDEGEKVWKTETITDSAVIQLYLEERKMKDLE